MNILLGFLIVVKENVVYYYCHNKIFLINEKNNSTIDFEFTIKNKEELKVYLDFLYILS